jgi:hypothetical protein
VFDCVFVAVWCTNIRYFEGTFNIQNVELSPLIGWTYGMVVFPFYLVQVLGRCLSPIFLPFPALPFGRMVRQIAPLAESRQRCAT